MNMNDKIVQRDWDDITFEEGQPDPRYGIYKCINCLDYGDNGGEPCEVCNKDE